MGVNERGGDASSSTPGRTRACGCTTSTSCSCPRCCGGARPGSRSGSSSHTPFPSSEVYRLLPAREDVLRGLLGADYVSFQVATTRASSAPRACASSASTRSPTRSRSAAGTSGIGVDPIGIDTIGFQDVARRSGDRAAARPARRAVRGSQARARRRAARLHEGHPAEAARVRAPPRAGPGLRPDDDDAPGARAVATREPRVPAAAERHRAPDLAHQRPLRAARRDAGRVPAPQPLEAGSRRAVPAGGRDDGDPAPRRDEPRRARVRPLPVGAWPSRALARRAVAVGARGFGAGLAGRAAGQSLERRWRRGAAGDGARARPARAPAPAGDDGEARRGARLPQVGGRLPHPARAALAARSPAKPRPTSRAR